MDAGCIHHFAQPNSDTEFAMQCMANESQPISCGVSGYRKIIFNTINNSTNMNTVCFENFMTLPK